MVVFYPSGTVAVSRGYDTCFRERLVMGYADYYWFWLKQGFNRSCGPLSEKLQAGDLITWAGFGQ